MKDKKCTVVGIGELLYDIFHDEHGTFKEMKAGGAPINFVHNATQLGAAGYAISAIGNDELGTMILNELKNNDINSDYISRVDYPTGTVDVKMQGKTHSFEITKHVAWDHIPLTQAAIDLMKQADAVCFGTLASREEESRDTIKTLLSYAPDHALRFFDINIRQDFYTKTGIEDYLKLANIFKINDDELIMLRSLFNLQGTDDEVCRWFMNTYTLRYVILTAGAEYSTIYSQDETSTIRTPEIKDGLFKDTVGAGDSFSGAFVYSILAGETLREAHLKAIDIAAFICTESGAWPSYTHYESWKHVKTRP